MSPSLPRVSVVIPTYNRAGDVARCLDSLVAQTYRDFEVLVCDDGSTDATGEIVARYRGRLDVSHHWRENFGGPARARNVGLRLARGAYVALLDSDDWWAPRKLAASVERLDSGADLVYHDLYVVRSTRQRLHLRRRHTRRLVPPVYEDLLRHGNGICNSSVVVRREILLQVGGFSEDRLLIAWEDYDAWLRIARVTQRFERLDETLGYYWVGGGNLSSPQRMLGILNRFRELYVVGRDSRVAAPPPWYHYELGLAHHRLGNHRQALVHLRRAMTAGLSARRWLRAAMTVTIAWMRLASGSSGGPAANSS